MYIGMFHYEKVSNYYFRFLLSSAAHAADSYQSISNLGYTDTDNNDTISVTLLTTSLQRAH